MPRAALPTLSPASRLPTLLRGPAEHHPLQHRQLCSHLLKLSLTLRNTLTQPNVLYGQLLHQRRQLLVRLQRPREPTPQLRDSIRLRNHPGSSHRPQQTPSDARNLTSHRRVTP